MNTPLSQLDQPGLPIVRLGHRPWLDGLRGVAVLLVLAFHWRLITGGWLGVDIFFVLSGFLITSLLAGEQAERGSISLGRFYLRRALRLLPAFYLILLLCGLHAWLLEEPARAQQTHREMLLAACYVTNYPFLHQAALPTLGHTWSLSLEEQFYLAWPLLLVLLFSLRLSRRGILSVVALGIAACVVHRIVVYHLHRVPFEVKSANIIRMYMGLDTRADALLVGALAGLAATWGMLPGAERKRSLDVLALASVVGLGYIIINRCLDHSQLYHGLFTGIAVMVALIIVRLLVAPSWLAAWTLENPALVFVGRISYGLYLFHIPVLHWVFPDDTLGWQWTTLAAATLTLTGALLSYYLLERPCLRLKDRLRSGQPSPATDAPAARAA